MTRIATLCLLALLLLAGAPEAQPASLQGSWFGQFPPSEGDEGAELHFQPDYAWFVKDGQRVARQRLEVQQDGPQVRLTLTSESNPANQALFTGTQVGPDKLKGRYVNKFLEEDFEVTFERRSLSLTVDPNVLTLPTGGLHYDPLLTLQDQHGKALWLDLPTEVRAVSSDPRVATVNERVRIRTTGQPGTATITIQSLTDPSVQAVVQLTTIDAEIAEVRLAGPQDFALHVGQTIPLEATVVLSTGHVIPHAHYSADLDVVTGRANATMLDGSGLTALHETPGSPSQRVPLALGFLRGGATAHCTLTVRPPKVTGVRIRLGGLPAPYRIPAGYHALLEVEATYEDDTRRLLKLNEDYTAPGVTPPGYFVQPHPGQTTHLQLTIPGQPPQELTVTTVDASRVTGLTAQFAHYPQDNRLLPGFSRELRVLADFPALKGYRLSAADPLAGAALGKSSAGWPTLAASTTGPVPLSLHYDSEQMFTCQPPLSVTVASAPITVPLPARRELEEGSHLTFRTLVDGAERSLDYPVLEFPGQSPHFRNDAPSFFLNAVRTGLTFQPRDPQGRPLPVAPIQVDVVRQCFMD